MMDASGSQIVENSAETWRCHLTRKPVLGRRQDYYKSKLDSAGAIVVPRMHGAVDARGRC